MMKRKRLFCLGLGLVLVVAFGLVSCSPQKDNDVEIGVETMNLAIGNDTFQVKLESNATVAALLEFLPIEITMQELNGNEKYFYFDATLPTNAQKVKQIKTGDVMLYGDNCLVIFYQSFVTPYSYTRIGHIEDTTNLPTALGIGNVQVKLSL